MGEVGGASRGGEKGGGGGEVGARKMVGVLAGWLAGPDYG